MGHTLLPQIGHMAVGLCALLMLLLIGFKSAAQEKVITGRVLDSVTHAPIQNVSVRINGSGRGALTDSNGLFKLSVDNHANQLTVSMVGYNPKVLEIREALPIQLVILMAETTTTLEGITVKYHRGKYRNKNNPAVALIREVVNHRPLNQPGNYPFASFQKYDKTVLSVDNLPPVLTNAGVIRRFHFLFENKDSTKIPGKKLIPIYIGETVSQEHYQLHPKKHSSVIMGNKSVNYGEFIDMNGVTGLLNTVYGDVDVYDSRIDLFGTQLLSPISDLGPTFYMYFIMDTTIQNGVPVVKMAYLPRNPDDLLFKGALYIPLDGHYAVAKAEMAVSRHINVNFVRSLKVNLGYKKDSTGHYYLSTSDMVADLGIFDRGIGMIGERVVCNTAFSTDSIAVDTSFKVKYRDMASLQGNTTAGYWNTARSIPLSTTEAKAYSNLDSLVGMPAFKRLMDWGTLLAVGYKQAGVFNFGPINTFYTYNPVEGSRVQLGGRTTPKLNQSLYAQTFFGYGLGDKQFKYGLNLTNSFNHQNVFNYFPLHYLQAGYQRDTRIPGQINSFSSGNSAITSFTQGANNQWLYNNILHLDYLHELPSHFSYGFGYQYWRQQPAGSLEYLQPKANGEFDTVHQVTTSSFSATVRWAPHEKFFQNQLGRFNIINHYPIINFSYVRGIKGLAGGQYNYDALHLNVFRRFYLAPIGFTDVTLDAGYLSGQLPFPLLYIHPANQTFLYFSNAYNLMNAEEFVSDHYVGLNFDHYFNGFFFNKIPLVKWLKLREVVAAKILYGGVRNENNPSKNPTQFRFPALAGANSTYVLNGQPYIEASVGIANIFKLLRVDLVRRMTYLSHANTSPWGVRFVTSPNF